jgi:hypothetical protein
VVLADPEEVDPDLVCQDRLRDDLADSLRVADERPAGSCRRLAFEVAEGVQTEGRRVRGAQGFDVHGTILAGRVGMGHGNRG